MRHSWRYLCFVVAASLLGAGEYSFFSPGIAVSGSKTVNSHKNITGSQINRSDVKTLFGIGLTSQLRLGELRSGGFNSLVLVPTVGFSTGVSSKHFSKNTVDYFNDDGELQKASDSNLFSKSKAYELTISLPLRWCTL
jgi:hypothetical protein